MTKKHSSKTLQLGIGYDTPLDRPKPFREPWSVAVVTNGAVAEIEYFKSVKNLAWVTATNVKVLFQPGDPRAVVERAERTLEEGYDEAWAVCDVDEYGGQLADVTRRAARADVGLALSNPCFEVWLILHYGPCARFFHNADEVGRCLKKLDPRWNKLRPQFADYLDRVPVAEAHAPRCGDPLEENPSSAVWKVITALKQDHTPTASP